MRRWGILLVIAAAMPVTHPAHGAEEVADYFTQDWYVTEVIVFQRPPVMEYNTHERLLITHPDAYPLVMRSPFSAPEQIGAGYRLDAATFTTLEPEFRTSQRPATFAVPDPEAPLTLPRAPKQRATPGDPAPAIEPALEANPLLDFFAAVAAYEETLLAQSFRWTPAEEHVLRRSAAVLGRRFNVQILLHERWIQPVPPRDAAEPVYVQAGPQYGATHLLEGTLGVTLGRYLHFQAQLVYREPGVGQAPISLAHPVQVAAVPTPALPEPVPGYMVLAESRRMRSEEVHYLDHPKLGIIVRIDPVAIPEDLELRFRALQESDQ